ncbi:MAG: tRNA pseudouridine(55) synthase TruB [Prevotellaceae bacterium]|nr:tRNA pseudouridine(55) synthase TruB [Prevotellaceae bacterium]
MNLDSFILPFDKPYGWSSFDAIRYVQRKIREKTGEKKFKIGHAGTLDPLATGVLTICIGKATKQAESLQAEQKEYLATLRLGATTPSFDLETTPEEFKPVRHITRADIEAQLQKLVGEQAQTPPVYSAKIINGKRAYTLARKGEEVEIKPSYINILSIETEEFTLPYLTVRIRCGKGTYIRSFARDLGLLLGCGAYLCALRRTSSGSFSEANMVNAEELSLLVSRHL